MDWKSILGDAYVDGMTDDECQAKFSELYVPKTEHEKALIKASEKANQSASEAAEWKKKYRSTMSEEEKRKEEQMQAQNAMQEELEKLKRENQIAKYKEQYLEIGYDKDLAAETAAAFYDGDTDTVLANQVLFKAALEKNLKAEIMKTMPVPPAGNGTKINYEQQIADAKAAGDLVKVSSLERQRAAEASQLAD